MRNKAGKDGDREVFLAFQAESFLILMVV